ncbi:metallophosphoesterase [Noviherbaspirillum autotrophicum]|uniref:Serine/threonine protein phosphatase n=1 Tax=Noviherbaspirillum autotrophicum TaxID=709839 RepID=A0A0C2BT80_9BURK|nr:metallophosphoesterase [Noviherbaspirillum autotrophicum]KIF83249.1 serine/threonine protein phosphatase [Noviherbaspirillum autotrophicum]
MRLRTFTVVGLLALLHIYIGARLLPAMPVPILLKAVGAALLAASVLLIPAGLLSHAIRRQPLADRVAWAGLFALGVFSSLLVLTLLRELVLLGAVLVGGYGNALLARSALAVPVLAAVVTLVGFINARRLARVVDVDIPIDGLPQQLHGFTIAQISDIHVGPTIKRGYLDKIVDRVNALEADLVAVTGDLVDGSVRHLAPHTAPLARLQARHGAYFVTGNHEYYSNAHDWIAEVSRLGLKVLMNEHVVLSHRGEALLVAGVTDFTAHHFDPAHKSDPHAALAGAPQVAVKVLLAHQPRSAPAAADAGFDLQLSGHTHGGQFLPWNFFVPMQQPYIAGLNRLRQMWVYTSRGTGYWGPPKRFGAPSEITRVRLVPA